MSLVFNMVGGGSGSAELPAIYVTYPAGSVCTCTNGSKTFTAKDASGFWLFAGLEVGTWTVTCTDGTKTASQTAEITAEGQSVSVELTYEIYFYDYGKLYEEITGSWTFKTGGTSVTNQSDNLYFLANAGGLASNNKPIDFTKLSTLVIECQAPGTYTGLTFGLIKNSTGGAAVASIVPATEQKEYTLDVSSLTGEYYFYTSSSTAFALKLYSLKAI